MTIIQKSRTLEADSTQFAKQEFEYWYNLSESKKNKDSMDYIDQTTYSFSIPPFEYLQKLKIPIFVTYGTKDLSAPFNDYLRFWAIQNKKANFFFKDYIGLEHNFFGLDNQGKVDYSNFNWDKVADDWLIWLVQN